MYNFNMSPVPNAILPYRIDMKAPAQGAFNHILNCPADILSLIGRCLSRPDAIAFTSVCTKLFNLRFADTSFGIIDSQRWSRVPDSHEAISSKISLPEWGERAGGRMLRNDAPGFTALTLAFKNKKTASIDTKFWSNLEGCFKNCLSEQNLDEVILRLPKLNRLKKIEIDCTILPKQGIYRLLETMITGLLPISSLSLSKIVETDISSNLFKIMSQFGLLENLMITKTTTPRTFDMLYSNQRVNEIIFPPEIGLLSMLHTLTIKKICVMSLPAELGQLSNLHSLIIDDNRLTSLPTTLGQLTNLRELRLQTDSLIALLPTIGQLSNLQSLTMRNDTLSSLSSELFQLHNLRTLIIQIRHLTSLPAEIGQLSNLHSLTIEDNNLMPLPAEMNQLRHLHNLSMWIFNPALLLGLEQFSDLDLHSLTIEAYGSMGLTALPTGLGQLSKLQSLTIYGEELTSFPAELGRLSNLRSLDISGASQLKVIPPELGQLNNLRILCISGCKLTALPATLGMLSNLQELTLKGSCLTAKSLPDELYQLRQLRSFTIHVSTLTAILLTKLERFESQGVQVHKTGKIATKNVLRKNG